MRRILVVLLLVGCSPLEYAFTPSVKGVIPKPDNCVIEVVTSQPSRDYQELGQLEYYNGKEPTTTEAFKKAVWAQVCQAGGDAVIAIADAKGRYTKGTVIAYTNKAQAPATSAVDK
jgi:hypothetical protein